MLIIGLSPTTVRSFPSKHNCRSVLTSFLTLQRRPKKGTDVAVCLLVQGRYGALFNWKSDLHKQKNVSKLKHNNGQIILRN